MNVKTFIDRPIFAGVISVLILIVGTISLLQLPIEQFPEIAPPTISVSTLAKRLYRLYVSCATGSGVKAAIHYKLATS